MNEDTSTPSTDHVAPDSTPEAAVEGEALEAVGDAGALPVGEPDAPSVDEERNRL
jgi:hypothetical protein